MTLKGDVEFDSAGYPHKVTSPSPEKVTEPVTAAPDAKGYYEELVRQRGLRAAFDIAVDDVVKARESAPAAISFGEGKKIYDQGWNDGIENLGKVLKIAVEARFRNR